MFSKEYFPMFQGFIFLFSVMNDKNKIEAMTRKKQNVFLTGPNISHLPLPSEYKKSSNQSIQLYH